MGGIPSPRRNRGRKKIQRWRERETEKEKTGFLGLSVCVSRGHKCRKFPPFLLIHLHLHCLSLSVHYHAVGSESLGRKNGSRCPFRRSLSVPTTTIPPHLAGPQSPMSRPFVVDGSSTPSVSVVSYAHAPFPPPHLQHTCASRRHTLLSQPTSALTTSHLYFLL